MDDNLVERLRLNCKCLAATCTMCEAADEIERLRRERDDLRIAVDAVLLAITDKGANPEYHDRLRRYHEKEWPMLWRAIAALTEGRRG